MTNYACPICGTPAYYDGRCGDGPILVCKCRHRGPAVRDRDGGTYYPNAPQPVEEEVLEREPWPHNPNGGRN